MATTEGLVKDNALIFHINQRVGRAKINGQIVGKQATKAFEHDVVPLQAGCREATLARVMVSYIAVIPTDRSTHKSTKTGRKSSALPCL